MGIHSVTVPALHKATHTLIFLHGLGDSGHGWSSVFSQQISPSLPTLKVILPHAPTLPLTIGGGQPTPQWFDIKAPNARSNPALQDREGMDRTKSLVDELIGHEIGKGRKVLLGGFSQGAAMTLYSGLQSQEKLEGLVVLSGFLPQQDKIQSLTSSTLLKDIPVFIAHGTQDTMITSDFADEARTFLTSPSADGGLGLTAVEWHLYEGMGHHSIPEEVADLKTWLKRVVQ